MVALGDWFVRLFGWAVALHSLNENRSKLHWTRVGENGLIPSTAVRIRPHGRQIFYFCEVEVYGRGKVTGTTKHKLGYCEYELDGVAKKDSTYKILTNPRGAKIGWKYSGSGLPPKGAVRCHESKTCYVGQSVYGDGICYELPGKIFSEKKQMIMVHGNRVHTCPFKLFLTAK